MCFINIIMMKEIYKYIKIYKHIDFVLLFQADF